jgi:hypothetical protein
VTRRGSTLIFTVWLRKDLSGRTAFPRSKPDPVEIMLLFRQHLLRAVLAKEKITDRVGEILPS